MTRRRCRRLGRSGVNPLSPPSAAQRWAKRPGAEMNTTSLRSPLRLRPSRRLPEEPRAHERVVELQNLIRGKGPAKVLEPPTLFAEALQSDQVTDSRSLREQHVKVWLLEPRRMNFESQDNWPGAETIWLHNRLCLGLAGGRCAPMSAGVVPSSRATSSLRVLN